MGKKCVFLDTLEQSIAYKKLEDPAFAEVEHEEGWYVRVPQKELNHIKAAHTTATIVSPYSFLYLQAKKSQKEPVLWILALEHHLYLVTFKDGKALFAKNYNLDDRQLAQIITEYLHDFYATEESFFIEEIEVFYDEGSLYEDPDLSERLLLPVFYTKFDEEKVCLDPNISKYYFQIQHKEPVRIGINKRFVFGVGGIILVLLIVTDIYLRYKTNKYDTMTKDLVKYQVQLANSNNEYQSKMLKIDQIRPIVVQLQDGNEMVGTKIRSLFDLVPDDIYLTNFLLKENALYLEGVAKSKGSFLEYLHKKLVQSYPKNSYKLKPTKEGYRFMAHYEEVEQ